jgi:hypothetical protein
MAEEGQCDISDADLSLEDEGAGGESGLRGTSVKHPSVISDASFAHFNSPNLLRALNTTPRPRLMLVTRAPNTFQCVEFRNCP